MHRRSPALLAAVLLCSACPADDNDSASESSTTNTTGAPTQTTSSETGATPTTGESTSAETPTGGETADSTGESEGSGGTETTGDSSSSTGEGTTGEPIDCDAVRAGPFEPALFLSGFTGSEDLAFDGKGGLALKRDDALVVVRADKSETVVATDLASTFGMRYLADGRLLVARNKTAVTVGPGGETASFLDALSGPVGIYPDESGAVWITRSGGGGVVRVAADLSVTMIVEDFGSPRGIVYDPQRNMAFYSTYGIGQIYRVGLDGLGDPGLASEIGNIAKAGGLTLDACGNLYVVDPDNKVLYRLPLGADGEALSEPVPLATLPSRITNAQFGVGDGFDDHTLYLVGSPGDVYTVALEFPGAPIVTVD